MTDILIIVNPASGKYKIIKPLLHKIMNILKEKADKVELALTEYRGHGTVLAKNSSSQIIIAAGGDGLVNEVAKGVVNTDKLFYVLPFGTKNVFCKEYGISVNPVIAAKNLDLSSIKKIPVGYIDNKIFLLMAGVGFDAHVVRNIEKKGVRFKLLKTLAHVIHGVPAFFTDKYSRMYIYVNGKKDMQGLEVNLTESITSEELDNIEKITKRIPVTTDESVEYSEDVDGLKVTTIVGSVRIEQDENNKNAKYSYQMVRLPANDERYNTLWDLLTEFNKDYNDMSVNEKINLSTEFSKLYTELINSAGWTEVKDKDLRIEQPEDAETGTQYILFLKEEADGNVTYDAQFLTSAQEPFENYENVIKEEKVVVKRTSKLPITGDSIALFIALAVIIVAIILVRRKMKKDSKH